MQISNNFEYIKRDEIQIILKYLPTYYIIMWHVNTNPK